MVNKAKDVSSILIALYINYIIYYNHMW